MGKYDFALEIDKENTTLHLLNKMIKAETEILEFGPANGRFTQYLCEQKKCMVDIVEIDKEAGNQAGMFARKAFLGPLDGNIENFFWVSKEEPINKYDHIIFADVLEHLLDPEKVLENAVGMLKPDGTILISIPNISHNSVIISLLHDEFEYRNTGILDNTHLKFFTIHSLKKIFDKLGIVATVENGVFLPVGKTEFEKGYESLPKEVSRYLRQRDFGNLYEMIFELHKKEDYYLGSMPRYINYDRAIGYEFIAYIKERGDPEFSPKKMIKKPIMPSENHIEFDLSIFSDIEEVRLDPLPQNCVVTISGIAFYKGKEAVPADMLANNAAVSEGETFFFNAEGSFLVYRPYEAIDKIIVDIIYEDYDSEKIGFYVKNIIKTINRHNELESEYKELESKYKALESENEKFKEILLQLEDRLISSGDRIRMRDDLEVLSQSLIDKEKQLGFLENEYGKVEKNEKDK